MDKANPIAACFAAVQPDSALFVNGWAGRYSNVLMSAAPKQSSPNPLWIASLALAMTAQIPHRNPVPPQRWHLTTLSPFLSRPLPSQFLHFCFFLMLGPFSLPIIPLPSVILTSSPTKAAFSLISKR